MSDNLLLTVLGAVGVGALIMGMNQNDNDNQIKEDWLNYQFNVYKENAVSNKNQSQISAVNYASNPLVQQSVQTISKLNREGVPQHSQVAQLQAQTANRISQHNAGLERASTGRFSESFVPPSQSQLGSGAVTRNDYVSYPQFNQTNPLQSPSLNLPAQIRYNPPSLDKMGITDAYQNQPMDYANLVEGYEAKRTDVNTYEKNPQLMPSGFNRNINQTNPNSFMNALNKGTSSFSSEKNPVQGSLPLSTMDSGVVNNNLNDNVVMFDRYTYSSGKRGGWRMGGPGISDLIRGDLAVCVDPCQKGWFQSSLQPKDLARGALAQIAGPSESGGASNSDVQQFAALYGAANQTGTGGQSNKLSTLQTVLRGNSTSNANVLSTTSFA
jgi:hypothetical protein